MYKKESLFFLKRLGFLIGSGIPLTSSLRMLQEQSLSRAFTAIVESLAEITAEGRPLASGFASFPTVWNAHIAAAIAAGEETGRLATILGHLADHLEKRRALERRLISAFIYPCIISTAAIALVVVLTSYIFPKILPLLANLGGTLPFSTRIVIAVSKYVSSWGILIFSLLALTVGVITYLVRTNPNIERSYNWTLLSLPFIGNTLRDYHTATIAQTVSLLLASSMPLPKALEATESSETMIVYRDALLTIRTAVESGLPLAAPIRVSNRLFPTIVPQLIAAGEISGQLPEAMASIADFYEIETDERIKTITVLIEPVLMLVLGTLVGFVAIAIIQPIYALTSQIHTV